MATRKQITEMINELFEDRIESLEQLRAANGPHSNTDQLLVARIQEDRLMWQELRNRHDAMFVKKQKK